MTRRSCSPRSYAVRSIPTPNTPSGSPPHTNAQGVKTTISIHFVSNIDGVYAYYVASEEDYRIAIRDLKSAGSHLIALDLEGVNLSKTGSISVLHIFDGKSVYIFDVLAVGHMMFGEGYLREMLTSQNVTKIMFDCRKDFEALFHQFQLTLDNVIDVQMAEIVYRYKLTRSAPRHYVGLTSAVEQYNIVKSDHIASYSIARAAALAKYCPARGGRIEVWGERPLDKDLLLYCAEDIKCIYRLYTKVFAKRLSYETCVGVSLVRIRETMMNTTAPMETSSATPLSAPPSPITLATVVSLSPPLSPLLLTTSVAAPATTATAPIATLTPTLTTTTISSSPPSHSYSTTPTAGALKCYVNLDVVLFSKFEDSMQQYRRMGFLKICAQKC